MKNIITLHTKEIFVTNDAINESINPTIPAKPCAPGIEEVTVSMNHDNSIITARIAMVSECIIDGTINISVESQDGSEILAESTRMTCIENGRSLAWINLNLNGNVPDGTNHMQPLRLTVRLHSGENLLDEYSVPIDVNDLQ